MQRELKYLMGKLLNNRTGKWRAGIGSIGLWVSAVLLLAAVQLQSNFSYLLDKEHVGDADTTYLLINRQLNSNNLNNTTLQEEEIEQLRKLPVVAAVGTVQPAYFKAILSVSNNQFPFQTDASFETVPAGFIDQLPSNWDWKEGDEIVPVILPSLYLDLYNFQFALAQQLPQLSPEIIKMLTFNITIMGAGQSIVLKGRVVGLSDRIQSLLVPAAFMNWANQRYATENKRKPSRVIIKTKDASSPQLNQFLQKNQLRTDQEKTRFSRYRQVVNWVAAIAGFSGLLLLAFALLVLSLFIQLSITGRKDQIQLLLQLGAGPAQLSRFLFQQFFPLQAGMVVLALLTLSLWQWMLQQLLAKQSILLSPFISLYTLGSAILLLLAIGIMNRRAIHTTIQSK
jgi:ABC-type antimicrobial peptide transport system permease subunit